MRVKCDYCGSYLESDEKTCPNCGAANQGLNRSGNGAPRTISELQEWYKEKGLPPYEVTRFFIGTDCKEAKCFGIYEETNGNIVVYKNKSDGTRVVRYEGSDEEFAVNEIYQKLKESIVEQKSLNDTRNKTSFEETEQFIKKKSKLVKRLMLFIELYFTIFTMMSITAPLIVNVISLSGKLGNTISSNSISRGYYEYEDNNYYYDMGDWYMWNIYTNTWEPADDLEEEFSSDTDDYYESYSYTDDKEYSNFEDSSYYDDNSWEFDSDTWDSNDWDTSSDWDYGDSWDSGTSDWDSDW